MNNRRFFLAGFTAVTALALSGCEKLKKSAENAAILLTPNKGSKRWPNYRYRLTVEVDTPEGVKTGSSVIEVETAMSGPNNIPSPGSLYVRARGEAVTVDLGERGLMFALMQSEEDEEWTHRAFLHTVPKLTDEERRNLPEDANEFYIWMDRLLAVRFEQKRHLPRYIQFGVKQPAKSGPPNGYPMLVKFDDNTKPETVRRVDPDTLAESFGAGVTLKSITVARTESGMTKSIEKRLPWLEPVGRERATLIPNPPRFRKDASDPLTQYLDIGSFSTELYK
jgi:hypothetical protein